ncbi:hypothetical protein FOMPIDRAFT_1063265 [Fomitopsis schrenkii]|uniref:FHA domain-containing protein n=1 Tax=Fomitopsis schrenkii TaxID=2126942 RepID=S8EXK8_FOMSC|nr:hypothetical protein FOMPIDRAFT_1063265 [Fomitopsis schrenkii]
MWMLTGPFDVDEHELSTKTKSKLLKAGVTYVLGRKEDNAQLVIRKKNISRAHFNIIVHEEDGADYSDPNYRPRLTIENTVKDSKKPVARIMDNADGKPVAKLNPGEIVEVNDGYTVHVVQEITMTARWVQVACLAPPTRGIPPFDPSLYASMGICVRPTPHPNITHHLVPTLTLTPELALSLITLATPAAPAFLADLIKAGQGQPSALEDTFRLPSADKYRPAFSQTLPPALKEFAKWAPNEARTALFNGFRFVFVGEKGREVQEAMRELVRRAQGEYECVACEGGRAALRKVLHKGRERGRILVLVGEEGALVPAVGKDGWEELVDEANSFDLSFTSREKILETVVQADPSLLNPGASSSASQSAAGGFSSLPDVVPNTHPDEPSIPPATSDEPVESQGSMRSRLRRRAGSRASSRAPSPGPSQPPTIETPSEEPPKRKGLLRRAARTRAAAEDTSLDLEGESSVAPPSPPRAPSIVSPLLTLAYAPDPSQEPTPGRSRLKRRAGTRAASADIVDLTTEPPAPDPDEPPLKKFRALFEESDPARQTQTQTQQEDGVTQTQGVRAPLPTLAEEEEESTTQTQTQTQGVRSQRLKRKARTPDGEADADVEMADGTAPPSKRRAVGGTDAVQPSQTQAPARGASKPPSRTAPKPASKSTETEKKPSGAAPGKPDTDEAFLKAVASTKKGKRAEDTFDREFNNLRISRPELEAAPEREAWAVLDDFGDDCDMRGNFMLIVELDVPEKPRSAAQLRGDDGRADWAGRPDFKKFKKKSAVNRRPAVELYAEDEDDIGSQLWRTSQTRSQLASQSQSQPQSQSQEGQGSKATQGRRAKTQTQTQTQKSQSGKAKAKAILDDDSDEAVAPLSPPASKPRRKGSSRAGSTQPSTKTQKTQKTQPLFIDESDEEAAIAASETLDDGLDPIDEADDFDDNEESTLRSTRTTQTRSTRPARKAAGAKRSAPVVLDDDSDDDAGFTGFTARRTRR